MSMDYHLQIDGQSEKTIQTLEDMLWECMIDFGNIWDTHLSLIEFSYNNNYQTNIKSPTFEALYGRKWQSLLCWAEFGDTQLAKDQSRDALHIGKEIIHETTKKIVKIKDRSRVAHDH